MDEISNKTIAALLVIAVIVSIGGTIISLNKLTGIRVLGGAGAATSMPAYVNLSIVSETAIFVSNNIDFGIGNIDFGTSFCVFNSSLTECANGTKQGGGTWDWIAQWIKANNTGTTNITINFTSDKAAAAFIGGNTVTPYAKIRLKAAPSGANNACVTTPIEISTSSQSLCPKLMRSGYGQDTYIEIEGYLVVPENTPANQKIATLTFSASQNSTA